MKSIIVNSTFVFLVLGFLSCNSTYSHKKKAYFNIDLPQHIYKVFDTLDFPYSFEYPVYAKVVRDSTFFDAKPENDYWINIDFPSFNARIFLSYKIIGGKVIFKKQLPNGSFIDSVGVNQFDLLVNDAFKLTNKNSEIATSISDSFIVTPNKINGVFFKVGGNAATARQFFLSDSAHNFIRGALYFSATPNVDSLKPVHDFLQQDILHLINTFKWNKKVSDKR
jgi:gliding motility-associated lipoprotein GldD